jgi:hypothetical protein
MPFYLVDHEGVIVGQAHKLDPRAQAVAGARWLMGAPPAIDTETQVAEPVVPVPSEATSVTYVVTWLPLATVQATLCARVDAKAEAVRCKYLTSYPLQSITYVAKEADARAYKAAGYPVPFVASANPYVDAEMRAAGDLTAQAAADRIIGEADMFKSYKGSAIEYERRKAKLAINAATDAADAAAAAVAGITALETL